VLDAVKAGEGMRATSVRPHSCHDIKSHYGIETTGIYTIYSKILHQQTRVRCDMTTNGGGWTVRSLFTT